MSDVDHTWVIDVAVVGAGVEPVIFVFDGGVASGTALLGKVMWVGSFSRPYIALYYCFDAICFFGVVLLVTPVHRVGCLESWRTGELVEVASMLLVRPHSIVGVATKRV